MTELFKLFWVFFKIGSFTFGGGLAMLPLIEREIVDNNRWMSREEFIDIIAATQCMPGVIAVNTAIYLGYHLYGIVGAVAGSLGAIIPSFVIMIVAASFFMSFKEHQMVQAVLNGIKPAVAVLIFSSAIKLGKVLEKNRYTYSVAAASLLLISFLGIHPILVIVGAAFLGIVLGRKGAENGNAG
ncbi:MAG: Chromate transport protein [Firmicutes bacterium]|nr:Chromate transport protein [Bacillota bacterium]MDI6707006.1 chromate transporter [Bacillota bacterium]